MPEIKRKEDGTYEKGVSGNPGGRPADPFRRMLRARLERDADQIVQFLWDACDKGDATSIAAIKTVLEYAIGKPAMAQEDREAMAAQQGGGLEALLGIYGLVRKVAPALPPKDEDE